MSFWGTLFNTLYEVGTTLYDSCSEQAAELQEQQDSVAQMSNNSLAHAYREMRKNPSGSNSRRKYALRQECLNRGLILSDESASQLQREWERRYSRMTKQQLREEYQELKRRYSICREDRSFSSAYESMRFLAELTPRLNALKEVFGERQ